MSISRRLTSACSSVTDNPTQIDSHRERPLEEIVDPENQYLNYFETIQVY